MQYTRLFLHAASENKEKERRDRLFSFFIAVFLFYFDLL